MKRLLFVHLLISFFIYNSAISQDFGDRVDMGTLESNLISEASGIAASRKNPGVFWTHNDSGGQNRIFAFNSSGKHLGTYTIAMIQNRDWEDIAVAPGPVPGEQYIYIANIGDNSVRYDVKYIYRITEPRVSPDQSPIDTALYNAEKLPFQYIDGNRNAETLMIDPLTLDIFIASKESVTKIYRVPWPYTFYAAPTVNVDTLEIAASILFGTAVGGDISPNGREILIKKKNIIYYWQREEGQTIAEALKNSISSVPYIQESQGEAVCWAHDSSGYYTLSEGLHAHLYFYPRLTTAIHQNSFILKKYGLHQNYPNPFNPVTTINFQLQQSDFVELKIYNLLGEEVATLVNENKNAGYYSIRFNADKLPSGMYIYRIQAGEFSDVKKMLFLK